MPEMTDYEPGTPSWVDLGSPDPDASARFYGDLFGWSTTDPDPDTGGYRMFTRDGKLVAGLSPLIGDWPPVWSTYVSVTDADETTDKARNAGGTVFVEPMDVVDAGRMAFFADPSGAAIGVWQPNQHRGAQLVNEPYSLCWDELMTRDLAGVRSFYETVFGWRLEDMAMPGDTGDYTVAYVGDRGVAGLMPTPDQVPAEVPSHWGVYFAVEDADATVAKGQELGAQLVMGPMDLEGVGRLASFLDPHHSPFSILKMSPPAGG